MNWISRLESVVGKIPTSMPRPPPTMPSNILSNFNYEPAPAAPATPVTQSLLPTTLGPQPNSYLPPIASSNILSPNFNYEPVTPQPNMSSFLPFNYEAMTLPRNVTSNIPPTSTSLTSMPPLPSGTIDKTKLFSTDAVLMKYSSAKLKGPSKASNYV